MTDPHIAAISIPNFRDVGGPETSSRRRVRKGRLYRSVALDDATDEDLETLARLGVTTIFDMRRPEEQSRRPDRLPAGAELLRLDVFADDGTASADFHAVMAHLREPERVDTKLDIDDMERFQQASYYDLVMLESARESYAKFFRTLAASGGASLVHCTGGKDRTGWAVASLLTFLDVPREDVFADYLKSDEIIRRMFADTIDGFEARGGQRAVMEGMFGARRRYLSASFDTVEREFGSIEAYFSEGLCLEDEVTQALRETFLEQS